MVNKRLISLTSTNNKNPDQVYQEIKKNISKFDMAKEIQEQPKPSEVTQVMFFRKSPASIKQAEKDTLKEL